jgi:hypothetical protein
MALVLIKKGNKAKRVPEEQKASFLAQGWDVLDNKTGKVKEKAPTAENRVKELEAEIAKLKK